MAGAAEEADEDVFGGELGGGELVVGKRLLGRLEKSYVGDDCHGDYEARKCKAVADFLHRDARGA
jgi:hypothetical protein